MLTGKCEFVSVSLTHAGSGGTELAQLGESGGAVGLEIRSTIEVALLFEIILDRAKDGGQFLQRLYVIETLLQ